MPTIARVRPESARRRRAFAVIAAACIFAVVPVSPAGAQSPHQIAAGARVEKGGIKTIGAPAAGGSTRHGVLIGVRNWFRWVGDRVMNREKSV